MSKDMSKENDSRISNNQGNPTIEEHAQKMKIGAPVFAAVVDSNKWASGKRMPLAVFEQAVKDFLGAPMGGK